MAKRGRPPRDPARKVMATEALLEEAAALVRERVPGATLRDIVDYGLKAASALEKSARSHMELDALDLPKAAPQPQAMLLLVHDRDPFCVLPSSAKTIVDPRAPAERGRTIQTLDALAARARQESRRMIRSMVGSLRNKTPDENREYLAQFGVLDDPAFTDLLTGEEAAILGVRTG